MYFVDDSDSDEDNHFPTVSISMEYVEHDQIFNFYIRRISNCPYLISYKKKYSRAVLYIVRGIHRSTWMRRPRQITSQEIESHDYLTFRTLAVERENITVFNEFFCCDVTKEQYNHTLLRIQFCDVRSDDSEVLIAECDYWINGRAIPTFHDFLFPLKMSMPDLGEVEVTLAYLPTAQRLNVERLKTTNLRRSGKASEIYLRLFLYTNLRLNCVLQTEKRPFAPNCTEGITFRRQFFDLSRDSAWAGILVIQAVEIIGEVHSILGQFGLSDASEGCDHVIWKKVLQSPRERVTEIFRLRPGI